MHRLLEKHRLLETVARRQETPRSTLLETMQHRQNLVELNKRLRDFHPADVARLLESLPPGDRSLVWSEVTPELAGLALVEASDAVRDALIEQTAPDRLMTLLRDLDADDLRYLSDALPASVVDDLAALLDARDRRWVEERQAYPEGSAARLMTQAGLSLRDSLQVQHAVDAIRASGALPAQTDRLFVVDARNLLVGAIGLGALIVGDPTAPIAGLMESDVRRFLPSDEAEMVATAFERYDLLSAPIVDVRGKLVGRVTADAVMDFIRRASENNVLAFAGLRKAEDLFAPVLDSARNRWPWLAVNLATAFVASRVIGAFEETIEQLVALAALTPIVASIGGNTGNQTVALVVRGLALDELQAGSWWHLLRKELIVGVLNGALWGSVVGLLAATVYRSMSLGAVMTGAVLLNLVVAAIVGVLVPLALFRSGRDPAQGASVMLTFVTDGMGFLIFLGLAKAFLF